MNNKKTLQLIKKNEIKHWKYLTIFILLFISLDYFLFQGWTIEHPELKQNLSEFRVATIYIYCTIGFIISYSARGLEKCIKNLSDENKN
ncbi:hypothetical protein ACMAZF_17625 [Psychrobium sp. nBUS_13]|uniref:hypothetical protein n=1 Tax=Psychrobium sp. nBUS_13 TaxID=3395319 RepID=UPI003EC0BED3